jgi:ribosomal protein S18 acetylase RimI-like enzyme
MAGQIILRPATGADVEALAQLWNLTFPDKFGPILGASAEPVLRDWLRLSQRHIQTTTIAEISQSVAGYIVLATPSAPRPDDGRWLWHALQLHHGLLGALRSFLLMALINHDRQPGEGEVYIEMLGVDPLWQGQGLGKCLLAYAEAVARSEQAAYLVLNVVSDNLKAIRLYQKSGFETTREQRSRSLAWITGHSGYYEMVKRL